MYTKVMVVDAQRLVREGISRILESELDIQVVATAVDGREAVDVALEKQPDVVVIDGQLPRLSGIEAVRRIREKSHDTMCIVISSLNGPSQVKQALTAGASGFVPKDAGAADLLEAVRTVRQGRSYLAPTLADQVISALTAPAEATPGGVSELTARQREVLQLIAEGLSTKEIAKELGISLKTAQTHRANVMDRVGVHKVSSLVRLAIREGLVAA
ncbi:MAG: DNA-binding response regulator [Spirochaeta sp.]|jgi:DNA-binding NarL/FixJ family response regulator|nr:DNA-binding response regulator [Spirochaeta sp.]RPG05504.1 MAG: DNA-binding response regulator [Proteobacteria bacterium TMED72]